MTAVDILWNILFVRAQEARRAAKERDQRFVHYTRADTAMSIIQNKEVWLRNALVMNDFQEIAWGQQAFVQAWNSDNGAALRTALDSIDPTIVQNLAHHLPNAEIEIRFSTFLTSLSEHDSREDVRGRLSMWRAYGAENGVALVLKNTPFLVETDALGAYSAPVWYATPGDMVEEFGRLASAIAAAKDQLRDVPSAMLVRALLQIHRFALLTTKHPGFAEEREWRIFHSPDYRRSDVLAHRIVSAGGVLQRIFTLPLRNDPDQGLHGAAVSEILDRIIIGPSRYPMVVYDAFVRLLLDAGIVDAQSRVIVSDIPLRQ